MVKFVYVIFGKNLGKFDVIDIVNSEDVALDRVKELIYLFPEVEFDYRAVDLFFLFNKVLEDNIL